jgi:hypothetical protein
MSSPCLSIVGDLTASASSRIGAQGVAVNHETDLLGGEIGGDSGRSPRRCCCNLVTLRLEGLLLPLAHVARKLQVTL